jgi:hypothetical protein
MYEQHRDDIAPEPPQQQPAPDSDRLQRGLILGLAGAVAVALIAFLVGVVLDSGGDEDVRASSSATTTFTTITEGTVLPGVAPPVETVPPTTAVKGVVNPITGTPQLAAAPTTTTTAKSAPAGDPCRNSHDPKCGPFRWDPAPGPNEALTASAEPKTQQATVGQMVNFDVVAKDPDAKIDKTCIVVDWGDGTGGTTGDCPPPPTCPTAYGPWAPPARVADDDTRKFTHMYAAPSQPDRPFVASFRYQSLPSCDPNPYGGVAAGSATVTVTPAP